LTLGLSTVAAALSIVQFIGGWDAHLPCGESWIRPDETQDSGAAALTCWVSCSCWH